GGAGRRGRADARILDGHGLGKQPRCLRLHALAPCEESQGGDRDDGDSHDDAGRLATARFELLARLSRERLQLVLFQMLAFSTFHDFTRGSAPRLRPARLQSARWLQTPTVRLRLFGLVTHCPLSGCETSSERAIEKTRAGCREPRCATTLHREKRRPPRPLARKRGRIIRRWTATREVCA